MPSYSLQPTPNYPSARGPNLMNWREIAELLLVSILKHRFKFSRIFNFESVIQNLNQW